jgi:AraC-like DNA-binding protein
MKDIIKEMHEPCFLKCGFYRNDLNNQFSPEVICYSVIPEKGRGNYWVYAYENLFSISIMDFIFYEDLLLEFSQPRHMSVGYFESVSGEELMPYKQLSCSCIRAHIGCNGLYQALYHKNIPINCTAIEFMPEYYEDYLKRKYPEEYKNPKPAFISIDGATDFHELVFLLKQIRSFRAYGISAKLYYEGKVAEAISLIVQKTKEKKAAFMSKSISMQDLNSLESVTEFIDRNFAQNIHLDTLARIACMGTTKLKYTFKEVYRCTVYEYILGKRMAQAKHLLSNTDLNINEISQIAGYKKASSFSEIFRKNIGLSPYQYRKLSMPNIDVQL